MNDFSYDADGKRLLLRNGSYLGHMSGSLIVETPRFIWCLTKVDPRWRDVQHINPDLRDPASVASFSSAIHRLKDQSPEVVFQKPNYDRPIDWPGSHVWHEELEALDAEVAKQLRAHLREHGPDAYIGEKA